MKNIKAAIKHLKKDPVLSLIIDKYGLINYPISQDYFNNLVSSIIGQQLSNKAADTIYSRFIRLFPNKVFSPQQILELSPDAIRGCGTSWAKVKSLRDLSQKVLDGIVHLESLSTMSDEEVITHLTQVKGIGRWTAEMKLMFTLQRPDILPLQDVGIHNAFVKLYGLNRKHKRFLSQLQKISANWQPYRTVACWYLWKSLDNQ